MKATSILLWAHDKPNSKI